jgi:ketosteroid isomerase-like protein
VVDDFDSAGAMYLLPMIFSLLTILFGSTFWASPESAASPTPTNHNDPSIIERADVYLNAVLAGDIAAVTAKFDDDAILMLPDQPSLRGRHLYEGWCHGPMKPTAFTFDHLEAITSGDYAYDVGTYKLSMLAGPSRNVDDNGKYTAVLKHSDGEWKIAYLSSTVTCRRILRWPTRLVRRVAKCNT